jgi:hypothetical protein
MGVYKWPVDEARIAAADVAERSTCIGRDLGLQALDLPHG